MEEEKQRRRHPRVKPPSGLVVAWQAGTKRAVSYFENLALGGVFILTRQPPPLRSTVKVLLDLPVGEVRARALVRRVAAKGMGIEFVSMTQEDRARLARALQPMLAAG